MRRFLLTVAGVATVGVVALAVTDASAEGCGDRPDAGARPHAAPTYVWSGLYIGAAASHDFATTGVSLEVQQVTVSPGWAPRWQIMRATVLQSSYLVGCGIQHPPSPASCVVTESPAATLLPS